MPDRRPSRSPIADDPDEGERRRVAERLLEAAEASLAEMAERVAGPPATAPATETERLYTTAHDLQAPLNAMGLRFQILRRHINAKDMDAICEDLDILAGLHGKMLDRLNDVLRHARTEHEQGPEADVDLEGLVHEVLTLHRDEPHMRHASIQVEALPVVRGRPGPLARLFENLTGNAFKYRHRERPLHLRIHAEHHADGSVAIHVADNGIGFEPHEAPRLFAPFERGPHTRPGHGVGLASCAQIATEHGATLTAHGRPQDGATFTVVFPAGRIVQTMRR